MAASLIERASGDTKAAQLANDAALAKLPKEVSGGNGNIYLAQPRPLRSSPLAEEAAKKAGDSFVTVERLLQALAIETSASTLSVAEECRCDRTGAQPGHQRNPQGPHRRYGQCRARCFDSLKNMPAT